MTPPAEAAVRSAEPAAERGVEPTAVRPAEPTVEPRYHPALDGLRGLAVAAVLAYHGGFAWMRGGYLGVSAFFTLSGFLITALLLAEHRATGRVSLRRFWARRARRLAPAALLALAGIVAFGATVATPEQVAELRADVLAALGQAANWRFVLAETSYGELGAAPSPVQHFWSLAIEEQLYLFLPLVLVGLLRAGRGRRAPVLVALGALAALSVAASAWLAGGDVDRAYFGTDARAAEVLVGALLAVLVAPGGGAAGARLRHRVTRPAGPIRGPAASSALALAALVGAARAWSRLPQTSPVLYRGGLALHALAIALVIRSALRPGPVRTVLGAAPLRVLGRISYGVYLYHWPVFLWLTPERTGLGTGSLFVLRVGITVAVAALSHALVEQPVRERRLLAGPVSALPARRGPGGRRRSRLGPALRPGPAGAGALAATAVALAVVAVTARPPPPTIDFAAARSSLASPVGPSFPATAPPTGSGGAPAPVVAGFGDSTALMATWALQTWSRDSSAVTVVDGSTVLGCGLPRGGPRRHGGSVEQPTEACETRTQGWPGLVQRHGIDVAVVQFGPWEVIEHALPGDDRWRAPGDPVFDRWLRDEISAAATVLDSAGVPVVWLTSPPFGTASWLERDGVEHRAGTARFNEIVLEVARNQPGMRVVDVAAYFAAVPNRIEDLGLRPDGVHFTQTSAVAVGRWLGPAVLQAARAPAGTVVGP